MFHNFYYGNDDEPESEFPVMHFPDVQQSIKKYLAVLKSMTDGVKEGVKKKGSTHLGGLTSNRLHRVSRRKAKSAP